MAEPAPRSDPQAGFTLIEAVTALGVFSIAAIALLNIGAQNARAVTALETRALARIVAGNELVVAVASEERPTAGSARGETRMAGRDWSWTRAVQRTGDPDILRITVTVQEGEDDPTAASATGFWGTQ